MENYFKPNMTILEVNQISALGLAHCGDAVFELLVRTWLCTHGGVKVKNLHKQTVSYVSAPAQAARMERMLPMLTEEEQSFYRRGRNAHVHGVPKNATHEQYSHPFYFNYQPTHSQRILRSCELIHKAGYTFFWAEELGD